MTHSRIITPIPVKPLKLSFPCLRKHKRLDIIVWFTDQTTGIVVNTDASKFALGFHSKTWSGADEGEWQEFNDAIMLQNQ